MRFRHIEHAQRLCFGRDEAGEHLAAEVDHLGARRVLLISEAAVQPAADRLVAGLPVVARIGDVRVHVPQADALQARELCVERDVDTIVCVGGGSATGLAKAIALTSGLPIVAVPTTYAGSEATTAWGIMQGRRKQTGVDARVLPVAVIADPALTDELPLPLSVVSGLNAIAHCVDSLWAPRADPINAAIATEGMQAMIDGLRRLLAATSDSDSESDSGRDDDEWRAARDVCLYAAYLSAKAFSSAGSGLHHVTCHVLGGAYDLPHAATHAIVLPHVLTCNVAAAPDAARRIGAALGADSDEPAAVAAAFRDFTGALQAPNALRDIGLPLERLDEATDLVLSHVPSTNPRPIDRAALRAVLADAIAGPTTATSGRNTP